MTHLAKACDCMNMIRILEFDKECECMRRIISILLLCLVLTLSLVGCGKDITNDTYDKDENSVDYSNVDNKDAKRSSCFIVDTDSLTFESSMETASGDITDIYTDAQYRYFVFRETKELNVLSLSDEMMASLEQKYYDNPDALISTDAAEQRLREAVMQYFPEYDASQLKLELNDEPGSCLEYYVYIVYEYDDINRVNTASISLAFDGTVSMVSGSHNSPEVFNGSDVYTSKQIEDIVFSYILQEKDNLALEIYPDEQYYENNGNQLQKYQLFIPVENYRSIQCVLNLESEKVDVSGSSGEHYLCREFVDGERHLMICNMRKQYGFTMDMPVILKKFLQ